MFIAAIIAVFVLISWVLMYIRTELFIEPGVALYDPLTIVPAACITFLLVYYNVI